MNKKIVIVLTFFYLFLPLTDCHAFSGLIEDFNERDSVNWNYTENGGSISFDAGVMSLSSTAPAFPILHRKVNGPIFPLDGDSVFEVKFKYDKIYFNGSGIGIGFTGIDGKPFYQFQIWGDNTGEMGGIAFVHNNYNRSSYGNCAGFQDQPYHSERSIIKVLNDLDWHVLRIERRGSLYQVYLDKDSGGDPIFTTEEGDCNPENIWLGNPLGGGTKWSYFSLDYMTSSYVDELTPRNKVIVVPGFGGSWNTEALVYNRPVTDDSWVMTPFVKNYDGLVNTLIEQGYERDKDLFVWNYDWRKPVADNVLKLNSFVDSKLTGTQKVDVVGHSMGGLIARIWAQDNIDGGKVGKVVTLGSPHSGLVKAYEWWNGAKISSDNDVGSIVLAILYQLNRRNLHSEVEVLRNYAPSLKDVLPTFDFVKKGSKLISGNDLYFKNDYLKGKNSSVNLIFDNLLTVAGIGQKTTSNLVLGERNVFDKVLNKWPDGSPLKYVYADGDGAVLKNSAVFGGDVYGEKISDHGQITDKAINTVLSELGVGVSSTQPIYEMGRKAVFFIGSPAYLNVKCGTDSPIVSDSLGFVLTENLGDCSVNVVGTGSGAYHLVTGTTYDDNWRYFEDSINVGETRVFLINNGKLKGDVVNLDSLYRLVKYDLVKLQSQYPANTNLTTSMTAANAKQVNSLMTGVFNFRKEKQEGLISEAIIKNIETILAIESRNLSPAVVKAAYVKAVQSKSLVDRMTRLYSTKKVQPSVFGAESYKLLEKMMDQGGSDYAKSVLAVKIASEVWR